MASHPRVLGLTLDPKLTYSTHIHNISVHAHNLYKSLKHSLQQDGVKRWRHAWVPTRLWSMPLPYGRLLHLRQTANHAKHSIENCHRMDTNIQHLHDEPLTHEHLQLYASQYKQKTQHPSHHIPYTNIQHTSSLQG